MKITIVLLFLSILQLHASNTYSQTTISLSTEKAVALSEVFKQIEQQSDFLFNYRNADIAGIKVKVAAKDNNINEVLSKVLKETDLSYSIYGRHITISKKKAEDSSQVNPEKITGSVSDAQGEPLMGVAILEQGTNNGTITDIDGKFTIQASPGSILNFSYLGYVTQEVKVGNNKTLLVTLSEDPKILDEVVVVGYGKQKKVNLTGSVSTINVIKEAESRPLTNLSSVLSGISSGVQSLQSSGKPNSDVTEIRIRGIGTLNDASPLVLVDGMEQHINDVNPNDVASISILKDAASCAIYGNRGANGVILITTKEGVVGKTTVNYSGLFSINQPSNLIELVNNSADYFELMNESALNVGQARIFSQNTIDQWREAEKNPNGISEHGYPNYVAFPNTDWYDELFQSKIMAEHTLSVIGSSEKVNYNFSGTFLDNPGLVKGTGLKKYYIRSNITAHVKEWLRIGNKTYGFHTDQERNEVDSFTGGLHGQKLPPDIYPYYDGKYGMPEAPEEDPTSSNPFHMLASSGGAFEFNKINTAMFADARILNDFVLSGEFDYSRYWHEAEWLSIPVGRYSFRQDAMVEQPITNENMSKAFYLQGARYWRFASTLTWNRTFGKHEAGALLGYEAYRSWGYDTDVAKKGASDKSLTDLSTYTELSNITGNSWENAARSYFGRATYAYDSRYLFEFNMRYDGSSRFSTNERWGMFPSVSTGWRISEEAFLKDRFFDNLKIRASWGKLGNNRIGDYEWQATYRANNYIFGNRLTSGLAQNVLANQYLQWESVTQTNIGIDFSILKNSLSGEIDYYNKKTDGILYRPSIYASMGNKTPARQNLAEVTNRGLEFTLNWNSKAGDVLYGISGNFSYNRNRVSKFKGKLERGWTTDSKGNRIYASNIGDISDGGNTRIIEGHIISEYYLKEPYEGDGSYYLSNGLPNPVGGPKDGMIRTEEDMAWLQAMRSEGYVFYPNQSVGEANLWYGDYIYADINGDGIYGNETDRNFQGVSSTPKYHFGLQANFAWKGIDFSMNWGGAAGFGIYWNSIGQNSTSTILGYGISKELQKDHYFRNPDDPNDPRTNLTSKNSRLTLNQTNQSNESSSLHLENGNFLKLRNLTLGYTLPQAWTQKAFMSKVRIFASGENLFTITSFSGMDPEMRTGMGYVTMRQIAFGININF